MKRAVLLFAISLLSWPFDQAAYALDIQFCSFNVLRLGTNRAASVQATKNTAIMEILNDNNGAMGRACDVIALHEATGTKNKQGNVYAGELFNPLNPGAFTIYSDGPYGTGGYKEWPVLAVRNGTGTYQVIQKSTTSFFSTSTVWRPPVIILIGDLLTPQTQHWFAAYHARWGKSVPQRRAEVRAVANLVNLLPPPPGVIPGVVIGADWNLTYSALKTEAGAVGAQLPANSLGPTTVNLAGTLSSDYDTFVWGGAVNMGTPNVCDLACITTNTTGIPDLKAYRQKVSDHLMVYVRVQ